MPTGAVQDPSSEDRPHRTSRNCCSPAAQRSLSCFFSAALGTAAQVLSKSIETCPLVAFAIEQPNVTELFTITPGSLGHPFHPLLGLRFGDKFWNAILLLVQSNLAPSQVHPRRTFLGRKRRGGTSSALPEVIESALAVLLPLPDGGPSAPAAAKKPSMLLERHRHGLSINKPLPLLLLLQRVGGSAVVLNCAG